jgi:hypothetical protein
MNKTRNGAKKAILLGSLNSRAMKYTMVRKLHQKRNEGHTKLHLRPPPNPLNIDEWNAVNHREETDVSA